MPFMPGNQSVNQNRPLFTRRAPIALACALMLILLAQLIHTARSNSLTWDEAHHLFDGYNILTRADYGLNPEVPPLVKIIAARPLTRMHLRAPSLQGRSFQTEAYLSAKDFVFLNNNPDQIVFRAQMACSIFTLLLALGIFLAGWEIFSPWAGLVALAFFVFDPNVLANGALITTDLPIACVFFWTIYLLWRYIQRPTPLRLVALTIATGLTLTVKFSGVLLLPIFLTLIAAELIATRDWRLLLKRLGALVIVSFGAYFILWGAYGFRYAARPAGVAMNPVLSEYLHSVPNPSDARHLALLARFHLFPEAFVYGLANTKITEFADTSYFFGHVYRHGQWLYFPAVFLIKSTLPFLILFAIAIVWLLRGHLKDRRRSLAILLIPPAIYFAIAMHSQMNIGARHLLPIYAFLYLVCTASAISISRLHPRFVYAVFALFLWQAIGTVRIAPAYMAFGNEAWGGPSAVHKYLSDANVDWGQQLKATALYLDANNIHDCWFAYFVDGVVDIDHYGVHCKRLPTLEGLWWLDLPMDVPPDINGTVLISDSDLAGIELGQGALNPYNEFRRIQPVAVIDHGIYVYQGHFHIPLASALVTTHHAQKLLWAGHPDEALPLAQQAESLAPQSVPVQETLGDIDAALHQTDEARQHYQAALTAARTIEPALQADSIPPIQKKLDSLSH